MIDSNRCLLADEQNAISAIVQYMIRGFNGNISYVHKKKSESAKNEQPHITKKVSSFWKTCINEFNNSRASFTDTSVITYTLDQDEDIGQEDIEQEDIGQEDIGQVTWYDNFDVLEGTYYRIKDTYGFEATEEEEFDRLFKDLYKKMRAAVERITEPRKINIGKRLNLAYLPQMLDLNNPNICKLLPYLLTSYVFNSVYTHSLYKKKDTDSSLLELIFGKNNVTSTEAPKIRKRIEVFARIFSLDKYRDKLIVLPAGDRPSPYLRGLDIDRQCGEKYLAVLNHVFQWWCEAVTNSAQENQIKEISPQICCNYSKELYDYYTMPKMG